MLPRLIAWLAIAAAPAPRLPSVTVEQFTLPNGLHVVFAPDPAEPLVAVNVRYEAGSVDDPDDRGGLAHLVEHLMFSETEGQERGFFERLEAAGGSSINAVTTFDHTEYFELVPAGALELTLWLEAERMGALGEHLTADRVEREKLVVENELFDRVNDRPYAFMQQIVLETMFPAPHPLHLGPVGTIEQLEQASVADATFFHDSRYGPMTATLVVAGAFDAGWAHVLVDKYFGRLKPEPAQHDRPKLAPPVLSTRPVLGPEWNATRPLVSLFWRGPDEKNDAARALEVFAGMLSYGAMSRAGIANMKEESLEALSAGLMATPAGNLFRVDGITTAGVLPALARTRIQSIIETYVTVPPLAEELEGTKRRMRLELVRRLAHLDSRAALLQSARARFGDAREVMNLPAAWEKVTSQGVVDALNRFVVGEPQLAIAQPIRR